jgi:small subunit ribosomal protein S17
VESFKIPSLIIEKAGVTMDVAELNQKLKEAIKAESLSTRGMSTVGTVVSNKAKKTVTVERVLTVYLKKYRRWARKRSKIHAHVPGDLRLNVGDVVRIKQTRKISKTKAWVVVEVLKRVGE